MLNQLMYFFIAVEFEYICMMQEFGCEGEVQLLLFEKLCEVVVKYEIQLGLIDFVFKMVKNFWVVFWDVVLVVGCF